MSPTVPILYSTTPSTHAIVCKGEGLQSLSILRIKHELAYLTLSKLGYFIIDFQQKLTYYERHHPPHLSHTFWTCLLNFWWLALDFISKGYLSDVSSKGQRWAWKKGGNYMRKWGKSCLQPFSFHVPDFCTIFWNCFLSAIGRVLTPSLFVSIFFSTDQIGSYICK